MLNVQLKNRLVPKNYAILLDKIKHIACLTFNIHKTEGMDANLFNSNDKVGRMGKDQPLNDHITDNLSLIFTLRDVL